MKRIGNFFSLAGAEVVSKVATFLAFAYLARVAGPEGLGYVEFAVAVFLCLGLLVDQGFDIFGAREVAKDPRQTASLVSQIVSARFVIALLAYGAAVVLVLLLDRPMLQKKVILLYCLSLFALPFLLRWVFQGHECMQVVAAAQIIRQVVFAAVVFLFLHSADRLWVVGLAELGGTGSAAVFFLHRYRRRFGESIRVRMHVSKRLLREGMTIGLSQIFWSLKMYGATLGVGLLASEEDMGYFGGAMRILIALHAFVWLYYFNLLPSMSRSWHVDRPAFQDILRQSMHVVGWLALGGGILWVLLGPWMVRLAYGEPFAPAGSTLQWLGVVCVLAAINGHFRFGLLATGHQSAEMVTAGLGALTALALVPLGYERFGPDGAAMALVMAEVVVWLVSWYMVQRFLRVGGHAWSLVRPVIAAGLVSFFLWMGPTQLLAIQVILAAVGFGVIAFASDRIVRTRLREGAVLFRRCVRPHAGNGMA